MTVEVSGARAKAKRLKREKIIEIARNMFLENGFSSTSMSEIAAKVGGSKSTVWAYFHSKEDLFEAVIDTASNKFRTEIDELFKERKSDLKKTLLVFCRVFIAKITHPDSIALYRIVVAEAERFPEAGRIFYESAPARLHQAIARYLASAMERGDVRIADPLACAELLTSICHGPCFRRAIYKLSESVTDVEIKEESETAVSVFLKVFIP